jgi:hypothetical protein
VHGETKGQAAGVAGYNHFPQAGGAGVWGASDNWEGVHGETKGQAAGVAGYNHFPGTKGAGVSGQSDNWVGVYGESTAFDAIVGESASPNHAGVVGRNTSTNPSSSPGSEAVGIYGEASPNGGLAGKFHGNVTVNGNLTVSGTLSGTIPCFASAVAQPQIGPWRTGLWSLAWAGAAQQQISKIYAIGLGDIGWQGFSQSGGLGGVGQFSIGTIAEYTIDGQLVATIATINSLPPPIGFGGFRNTLLLWQGTHSFKEAGNELRVTWTFTQDNNAGGAQDCTTIVF